MKTLKKTLCLVLAVVMAVGVLVIPANAATSFPDDADIEHDEAVAVLNGLGILKGDDKGNFNPEGTLTRAQAAVIIARLDMTPEEFEDYVASEIPFDDVAGTDVESWAGNAIAYCVANGIIGGVGGNKFDPNGLLTGAAFAKMLLCVLDYDGATEGFGTSEWAAKVENIARSSKVNLNKNMTKFNYSAVLSRDDAAQMAYNAMKAFKVEYQGGSVIEVGGISIKQGATRSETTINLFEGLYGLSVAEADKDMEDGLGHDDFGAPYSYQIVVGDDAEALYVEGAPTVKTYTAPATEKAVTNDLKDYDLKTVTIYTNGKAGEAGEATYKTIAGLTGNGYTVAIYADGTGTKDVDTIVAIQPRLAKITSKTSSLIKLGYGDKNYTTTPVDVSSKSDGDNSRWFNTLNAYAKGSYVAVVVDSNKIIDVVGVETVEGKLTAKGNEENGHAKTYSIDGDSHKVAKGAQVNFSSGDPELGSNTIAVVDANGLIYDFVVAEQTAKEVNSMLVTGIYQIYDEYNTPTNMFQGVLPDGEVVTGEYADTLKEGKAAYTYEINSKGQYVFTKAEDYDGIKDKAGVYSITSANVNVTSKTTKLDGNNYFDSNVMFIKVEGEKADIKVTPKTGLQKVNIQKGDVAVITKNANGLCVVTAVYLLGGDYAAAEISGDELLYINDAKKTGSALADDGETKVDVYTGYLNGEKIEDIIVTEGTGVTAGWNSYKINEKTGIYTLNHETSKVAEDKANVTITYVNDTYYMDVDGAEYDATEANLLDVSGASSEITTVGELESLLETNTGVTISYAYDDDVVTMIYVTNQGEVSE